MVGQNAEAAAGMFIASLVSLAAQTPVAGAEWHGGGRRAVHDPQRCADRQRPTRRSAPVADRLGQPRTTRVAGRDGGGPGKSGGRRRAPFDRWRERRDRAATLLVDLRLAAFPRAETAGGRFQLLARAETAKRADQQFVDILRDGPAVGIHTIVWCDTLTNFQRMLERQTLKEFETRLLLQMSATDSSMLMDSPGASTLGKHRALLHREDEGRMEKFRPFSPPRRPGSPRPLRNWPV